MVICGLIAHKDISQIDALEGYCECLRPGNHSEPHIIKRTDGVFVAFQQDWDCDCEGCNSVDSDMWCEIYREVSKEEAQKLIEDRTKNLQEPL